MMKSFLTLTGILGSLLVVAFRRGICLLPILTLVPMVSLAADHIPGEERAGIIHALTHLPPVTYLILLAIVLLSVINLVYRGWLKTDQWPLLATNGLQGLTRRPARKGRIRKTKARGADGSSGTGRTAGAVDETWRKIGEDPFQEGVLNAPRAIKKADDAASSQPTPLDGVNHPLPDSLSRKHTEAGSPRMVPAKPDAATSKTLFKFTSAVELPSQEEIERRDKQKLVVSGIVTGMDGKGLGSVLVYLTDERGNRIGQSCRSVSDTGEFKVLVNEPGKYRLLGYKRGFIMEDPEAGSLPIESGKIEGYTIRMIPEGCLVHGRVIFEEFAHPQPEVVIRCVRPEDGFTRSASVESAGAFRITGVPHESTCHLEVLSREGEILATSDGFHTEREREVFRNINIPPTQIVEAFEDPPTPPDEPLDEQSAEAEPSQSSAPPPVEQA